MREEEIHEKTFQEILDLTITGEADSVMLIVTFKDDIFIGGSGDRAVSLAAIATVLETVPQKVLVPLFASILKRQGTEVISPETDNETIH